MTKFVKCTVILLAILSIFGCSKHRLRSSMPVDQKMARANQLFDSGKYSKASEFYLDVVFERSSVHTPIAQFMLAESYFRMSRYADAIYEYRELIRLFPDYRDVSIAYFRLGEAFYAQSLDPHYSQIETNQSIDAFNIFLDRFPFHSRRDEAIAFIQKAQQKLLEKKFLNGYIYYKMYDYSAAMMYFNEIIELGLIGDLDRDTHYYAALIYLERNDLENSERTMIHLENNYPDSGETARIVRMFSRNFQE